MIIKKTDFIKFITTKIEVLQKCKIDIYFSEPTITIIATDGRLIATDCGVGGVDVEIKFESESLSNLLTSFLNDLLIHEDYINYETLR